MAWRVAKSLLTLRDQINAAYPGRSRASDGTIGDAAHQAQGSDSDHNPWVHLYGDPTGIVTGLDVTHDPAHGCDIDALTDQLQASRDPRIKYVIANGLIMSGAGGPSPWAWRAYGGSDPHTNHMHVSVVADARCDDPRPWAIAGPTPTPEELDMNDPMAQALAWRMDALIVGAETVRGGPTQGEPMWIVRAIKALATAVSQIPGGVGATLKAEFDELDQAVAAARAEIGHVDEAVIAALPGQSDAALAQTLEALLGPARLQRIAQLAAAG